MTTHTDRMSADDRGWPALPLAHWHDTRDTLHLWTQIVGKTRLALAPHVNQWWQVTLYVNAVGLTTSLMPADGSRTTGDGRGLEIVFNFVEHILELRTSDGGRRTLELSPRSVADFYAEYRARLGELGVEVVINPMPAEIAGAVPFDTDHEHTAYDRAAVHDFWRSLVSAHRVLRPRRDPILRQARTALPRRDPALYRLGHGRGVPPGSLELWLLARRS
jgi:Family of unknown function (DUF5996)